MRKYRIMVENIVLATAIIALVVMFWIAVEAKAAIQACPPPPSAAKIASLPKQYPRFYRALRTHFGAHWRQAAVVSWKEGSWHWWASNGQYKGTFQMGSSERARWGHSNTLAGQALAASRYFKASGRDWSPWECQP